MDEQVTELVRERVEHVRDRLGNDENASAHALVVDACSRQFAARAQDERLHGQTLLEELSELRRRQRRSQAELRTHELSETFGLPIHESARLEWKGHERRNREPVYPLE